MSNSIDNRVVELGFDNTKFEKGVSTSMTTLQKLNNLLDRSNSTKGFEGLSNSVKGLDVSPVASAVEKISEKFSTLGIIGITALENITNRAVNAGIALTKSLSIDQVTAGWQKYGDKTTAVATIINNAKKEFTGEAYSIEEVSDQLDRLNWFTDETSYNFVDMVGNIGKFTSQGQSLEKANTAMQGIATWAAVSGQNANSASRAMYNMSQALGVGAVKLMDWKSIENANMATQEFKQTAIETAIAIGTLVEKEGQFFTTEKNTEVTVENFSTTLSDAWFNAEVLMATLQKYGGFGSRLAEVTEELDITATDFLKGITEFQNGSESEGYVNWLKESGYTAKEITPYMEELTSAEYELGLKAFKAAQEARTFRDAIDAIKDGVSTSWMNLFETVFGNYEEAKTLWTNFANSGYDIFAEPINKLNDFLNRLKTGGSFQYVIDAFNNIKNLASQIIKPIKSAFSNVFPSGLKITQANLVPVLRHFSDFTKTLSLTEEQSLNLEKVFNGAFSVFKKFGQIFKNLANDLKPLLPSLGKLGDAILKLAGQFGEWLSKITDGDSSLPIVKTLIDNISSAIEWLADKISGIDLTKFTLLETVVNGVKTAFDGLRTFLSNFDIRNIFQSIVNGIKTIFSSIDFKEIFNNIKDAIGPINWGELIFGGLGASVLVALTKFLNKLSNPFKGLKDIFSGVTDVLDKFADSFKSFTKQIAAGNIKKIASGILMLAVALVLLSSIEIEKMSNGLAALFGILVLVGVFIGALTLIAKSINSGTITKLNKLSSDLIKIAAGILILSIALKAFSSIDSDKIGSGLLAMLGSLAIVVAATFALSKIKGQLVAGASAILIISFALIVLSGALAAFSLIATNMEWVDGLFAMAGALGVIAIALIVLGNTVGSMLAGAAAIFIVSAALAVLSAAVAGFALIAKNMDWIDALFLMAGALGVITIALYALSGVGPMALVAAAAIFVVSIALTAGAAAFLIFAVAANVLTPALQQMAAIGFGTIALGLVEFAGAMFVMTLVGAIAGALSPLLIGFAIALLVLSPALEAFVPSVQILEKIDLLKVAEGLAAIAGALALFDVALAILTPLSPVLAIVANSFDKLGDAILNFGTGGDMFADSLNRIKDIGGALISDGPKIKNAVKDMIDGLSDTFTNATPQLQAFEVTFTQLGTNLGTRLNEGFKNQTVLIIGVVRTALNNARSAISAQYSSFYSAGAYAGQGLANGLSSMWWTCYQMGASLAAAANQGFNDTLDIRSPSRVMFQSGVYAGQGAANGGLSMITTVYDAFSDLGEAAFNGLNNSISMIAETVSSGIDVTPTITPVLDLSEIQNGVGFIDKMFGNSSISLNGSVNRARSAYISSETPDYINQPLQSSSTTNFIQNNYSPKALSRIEIYRQTKNLITAKVG